jgi:hypothetical protein
MSDKDKAKPSKSVMGNLPSTRPTRMARRRDGEPVSGTGEAKPRPKAAAKTARKPTQATPKAVGKPAAKSASKPKAAARPKATAGTKASGSKPRAVRSGSPSLDAKKKPRTPRRAPAEPPKGTELVTTAVQATGELAKIGLTLGSQALKRAARRLPKP